VTWMGELARCGHTNSATIDFVSIVLDLNPAIWGHDRGYRVLIDRSEVVVVSWVELSPNPHPLRTEGAAPRGRLLGDGGGGAGR
jgi:hypothetical protein